MRLVPSFLLVGILLSGCATLPAGSDHPQVMASFYPIEFLARQIGGPDVTVGVVVKPGTEPHDYEPTPGDFAKLADAKLVLLQGASFESWIDRARREAPGANFTVVTEGLSLHANPDTAESSTLPQDPHTWLDPVLYAEMANNTEAALATHFPEHAAAFHARAAALRANLTQLHREFAAGLAHCDVPFVVTNHAAFAYLGQRYNFTMIAISGLDPESEPTPQTLQNVVDEVKAHNVTVVFFEDLVSPKVADAVAKEAGARTRVLSPIEGIPPEDAARGVDYMSRMRDDLVALRDGMRCP